MFINFSRKSQLNNHPQTSSFSFKNMIYKLSLAKIILIFVVLFFLLAYLFYLVYDFLIGSQNISSFDIFKFALYQSFGFDTNDIDSNNIFLQYVSFIQKVLSLVIQLIFTSAIVLKYFTKPKIFQFKQKLNFANDLITISVYNKSKFEMNNCKFTIYARIPYKDENGNNSLNVLQLIPQKELFPFMDTHMVCRIKIDLNDPKNHLCKLGTDFHPSFENLLSQTASTNDIQKLKIAVIIEALSPEIDNTIFESHSYEMNICDHFSIASAVTFSKPNPIDIDMNDFSKSKGWENFED